MEKGTSISPNFSIYFKDCTNLAHTQTYTHTHTHTCMHTVLGKKQDQSLDFKGDFFFLQFQYLSFEQCLQCTKPFYNRSQTFITDITEIKEICTLTLTDKNRMPVLKSDLRRRNQICSYSLLELSIENTLSDDYLYYFPYT